MATRLFWLIALGLALQVGSAGAAPAAQELADAAQLQRACAAGECSLDAQVQRAVARAGEWMAAYATELRFDAAIALYGVRRHLDSPALRRADEKARAAADHDHDHPHQRLWRPDYVAPAEHTSRWRVPSAGEPRANLNNVISEALFCAENGWRAEAQAYVCGPMRDGGGYQTTHGLWALVLAQERGCAGNSEAAACRKSLVDEIVAAQPVAFQPQKTLDMDLYGERLLMVVLAEPTRRGLADWAVSLLRLQNPDGSWGIGTDADPYFRYHATGVAAWGLAAWWAGLPEGERARVVSLDSPSR